VAGSDDDAGERAGSSHRCTGTIGAHTVTVVRVPSGATCRLLGTTVVRDVVIGTGGRLVARRMTVGGDVVAWRARRISLTSGSLVAGNLVITHGGSGFIGAVQIRGDVRWSQQTGLGTVRHTLIGGDLVVGRSLGRLVISGNRIGGDLRCRGNPRIPIRRANLVGGRRIGQCASLPFRATGPSILDPAWRPPCAGDSRSDDPSDDQCSDD
jgi:hypothetical protein